MHPPPPSSPFAGRGNFWRWSGVGRAVLASLVLLPATLLLKWRLDLRGAVKSELALCRAANEAVTLTELAAQQAVVPDAENAAIALLEIWGEEDPEFWEAWRADQRPLPERRGVRHEPAPPVLGDQAGIVGRGEPFTPAQRAAAEAWWKSNEVRMSRVSAALQRPRMRFPLNFEEGGEMLIVHLTALRNETARLRLRALMAAEHGDAAAALAAIESSAAAARLLEAEPMLLSQLLLVAKRSFTRASIEEFLNRLQPSPDQLHRLSRAITWDSAGERHRLALRGERVFCRWTYSRKARDVAALALRTLAEFPEAEQPSAARMTAELRLMRLSGLTDADELLLLQTLRRAVAAAEPTHANRAKFLTAFDEAALKAQDFPPRVLSAVQLPSLGRCWDKFARSQAETEMMRLALALERHRLDHGTLPSALEAMVPAYLPAVAEDPFSGKPLRYRRLDHGYLLYSVGPDGVDDGGRRPNPKAREARTWDLAFTVERPDLAEPGAPPWRRGGGDTPPVGE